MNPNEDGRARSTSAAAVPLTKLLARWGTADCTAPGSFAAPHGLALDSKNDLYVSEVTWTFAVSRGRAPEDCHTFQKFALVA